MVCGSLKITHVFKAVFKSEAESVHCIYYIELCSTCCRE